jgi:eukaryotic-like serine/threonine-protein kinase
MATTPILSGYRFGPFVLDLRSGQLMKNGRRVRLQEKPRSLLIAFAERPGEVITRAELHERLWPQDTFVDFEDGLNTAMRKLREALDDDPQSPRFIETVRGRGYRFVEAVETVVSEGAGNGTTDTGAAGGIVVGNSSSTLPVQTQLRGSAAVVSARRASKAGIIAAFLGGCAVVAVAGGCWYWLAHGHPVLSFAERDPMVIADFDNQTGDPHFDRALGTAFTVSLQQSRMLNIYSRLQIQAVLRLMKRKDTDPITAAVGREICQRENLQVLIVPGITRVGSEYQVTAQLIDPSSGVSVRSYAESARDQDHILDALDGISGKIRRDLGESRYEIRRNHRPLPQVTTTSMQALQDYTQASEFFGQGRSADASRLYHAAIAADSGFAMAWAGLAYMDYSFYINRPDLGESEFRTALSLAGRTTEREHAWIEMRYAESQGRIDDALGLYRLFLQRFPGDWAAEYSYARLLRMHGHPQEAVTLYQQLIRQQPDDDATWIELASACAELRQWDSAVQAYEKAFAVNPARMLVSNINHEYGFALVNAGSDEKAAQVFSSLLANAQTYSYGERSLALLDMYHGQYESARHRLTLALAKSQDPYAVARIRYLMAMVAAGQGSRREEIAQLDAALAEFNALGPKVEYGAILGQAYARAGDTPKARMILDRIAPIANDRMEDQAAYLALLKAEVAAAQGDMNAALQYLKPPANDDTDGPAQFTREALAHVSEAMGNRDAAIAWYGQFLQRGLPGWEPQRYWFEAEYTLAQDYRQQGDRASAIRWDSALLDPWKNADAGLPLLRDAQRLRAELAAGK